jgi:hypothetical protein
LTNFNKSRFDSVYLESGDKLGEKLFDKNLVKSIVYKNQENELEIVFETKNIENQKFLLQKIVNLISKFE